MLRDIKQTVTYDHVLQNFNIRLMTVAASSTTYLTFSPKFPTCWVFPDLKSLFKHGWNGADCCSLIVLSVVLSLIYIIVLKAFASFIKKLQLIYMSVQNGNTLVFLFVFAIRCIPGVRQFVRIAKALCLVVQLILSMIHCCYGFNYSLNSWFK